VMKELYNTKSRLTTSILTPPSSLLEAEGGRGTSAALVAGAGVIVAVESSFSALAS